MQLGPYTIVESLGSGGMGHVYRARDERLSRDVAVKVITDGTLDAGVLRRFQSEARALAAITHANLVSVYDVSLDADAPFIVTELVDGQSLRHVLKKGRIALAKALDIATQIAAGLTAAHEAGIVHRDLKPENIMLTQSGTAKLIDFGLAKHTPVMPRDDVTATVLTDPGIVIGTAGYMSPEQASGLPVDPRSDQFALGAIVYELLTGQRAFEGDTTLETLAAVLQKDPPLLKSGDVYAPVVVLSVLKRCLSKDKERRFAATRDLLLDLETAIADPEPIPAQRQPQRWFWPALLVGTTAATAVATFALFVSGSGPVLPPKLMPVAVDAVAERRPQWGPDGRSLLFLRETDGVIQVFTKATPDAPKAQITRSTQDCSAAIWSSDGSQIYYVSGGVLYVVGASGGQPQRIDESVRAPAVSPDGATLAYFRGVIGKFTLSLRRVDGGLSQHKRGPFSDAIWVPLALSFSRDGKKLAAVWANSGAAEPNLWIVPLPDGEPYAVKMPPGIRVIGNTNISWMPDNETILFGSNAPDRFGVHLISLNVFNGVFRALTGGTGYEADPDVNPDGSHIAFTSGGTEFDLTEFSTTGREPRTLLATALTEQGAHWHPNGNEYVFSRRGASGHSKLFSRTAEGSWERPVLPRENQADEHSYYVPAYSPDGQRIVYEKHGIEGHVLQVSLVSGTRSVRIDSDSQDQHNPVWSADGSWILYSRQRKGVWEIAQVKSDGSAASPITLTSEGVLPAGLSRPVWSPAGELIAYTSPQGLRLLTRDRQQRVLTPNSPALFGFSKTDREIIGLRRTDRNTARTVSIDTSTGAEKVLGSMHLPPQTTLSGFSLHPSGTSFLTTTSSSREDVWVLETASELPRWRRWFRMP